MVCILQEERAPKTAAIISLPSSLGLIYALDLEVFYRIPITYF